MANKFPTNSFTNDQNHENSFFHISLSKFHISQPTHSRKFLTRQKIHSQYTITLFKLNRILQPFKISKFTSSQNPNFFTSQTSPDPLHISIFHQTQPTIQNTHNALFWRRRTFTERYSIQITALTTHHQQTSHISHCTPTFQTWFYTHVIHALPSSLTTPQ